MPPRRFNGPQLKTARRRAGKTQLELARSRGVDLTSHAPVAQWEAQKTFPPGEKLPGIATALGVDIDVLFPREGPCDLTDVRCDAAYSREGVAQAVGISLWTLGAAERGERRLDTEWVPLLAGLYQVSTDRLLAAQRRSFGEADPEPSAVGLPALTVQLRALVAEHFPEDEPSPDGIAAVVNAKAGTEVVRGDQVDAILRGVPADRVFGGAQGARTIAITGFAHYFGVSELVLDDLGAESRVLADLQYLAGQHGVDLAARGGEGGLSAAMIAVLSDVLARGGNAPQ
ncbi:helix-turn-helix domain-containing protein [Streptomyces cyaneofuscatus]|uniref:helix-turn-helix domain-containing protein n=1 Tax=Streptomyces cyaneofuscatus TaxID=66883 RepID=UPI00369EFE45